MTPHIKAMKGEIAKIVLMPGDPLRAKFIAETYLDDYKLVSSVRNILMYTGKFKGKEISVCASGMGQPSMGIYAYELFKYYDVEKIIRIGTAGSYTRDLNLYDVFLATSAYSDSKAFNKLVANIDSHITEPTEELLRQIRLLGNQLGLTIHEGRVHSSDVFYSLRSLEDTIAETGARCVEMESGALFAIAKILNKQAACLLTISDNLVNRDVTTPEERQTAFVSMVQIALEII